MKIKRNGKWIYVKPHFNAPPDPPGEGDPPPAGGGGGAPPATPPANEPPPADYGDFDPAKFEKSVASRKGFREYITEKYVKPAVEAALTDDNNPTAKRLKELEQETQSFRERQVQTEIREARAELVTEHGLTKEQASKVRGTTAEDVLENGKLLAAEIAATAKNSADKARTEVRSSQLPYERKPADRDAIPTDPKEREKYFKEQHRERFAAKVG